MLYASAAHMGLSQTAKHKAEGKKMPTRTRNRRAKAAGGAPSVDAANQGSVAKRRRGKAGKGGRGEALDDDEEGDVVVMFWTKGTGKHAPFLRKDGKWQRRLDARTAALLGLRGAEAQRTSYLEEAEDDDSRQSSGLRTFVARVASWVYENGSSNSTGMVDHLAREYSELSGDGKSSKGGKDASSMDDRSVRRRVYDALNVLDAIGVVRKTSSAKREAEWVGYLRQGTPGDIAQTVTLHIRHVQRVHTKLRRLRELLSSIVAMKQLAKRNSDAGSEDTRADRKLFPPFLLCAGPTDMSVRARAVAADPASFGSALPAQYPTADSISAVEFALSHPPTVLDDVAALHSMGLGLPPVTPQQVYGVDGQGSAAGTSAQTLPAAAAGLPEALRRWTVPSALAAADASDHALFFLEQSFKDAAVDVGAPSGEDPASETCSGAPTTVFAVGGDSPEAEVAQAQARLYSPPHIHELLTAILVEDASTRADVKEQLAAAMEAEARTSAAIRRHKQAGRGGRGGLGGRKRTNAGADAKSQAVYSEHIQSHSAKRSKASAPQGGVLPWQTHSQGVGLGTDASLGWHSQAGPFLGFGASGGVGLPHSMPGPVSSSMLSAGAQALSQGAHLARAMASQAGGAGHRGFVGFQGGAWGGPQASAASTTPSGSGTRRVASTPRTAAAAAVLAGVSPRTAEAAASIARLTQRARAGTPPGRHGAASLLSPSTTSAAAALVRVGSLGTGSSQSSNSSGTGSGVVRTMEL